MHEGGRKAILAALLANIGIAVAKFVGFVVTGSAGMLAEGVHSVADSGNQALLFLGGSRARKAPTTLHPFGFGRERYFWAFVVAIVLFTLGAGFAVYEGVQKLIDPHEVESLGWAIGILSFAFLLELWSLRTAYREARHAGAGRDLLGFIRRTKSPELPTVLLEDTGALIGLAFALTGVILTSITGNARWDGVGSVAIGLLLGVIAITLATEMKSLLIGEAATPEVDAAIRAAVAACPTAEGIIHLRTQHLGPEEVLVGLKVAFRPGLSTAEVAAAIDAIEASARAASPGTALVLYVEPDLMRTGSPPA